MNRLSGDYSPDQLKFIDELQTYLIEKRDIISTYIEDRKNADTEFGTVDFEEDILEQCNIFGNEPSDKGLQYFAELSNNLELWLSSDLKNLFYLMTARLRTVRERRLTWEDYFSKRNDGLETYSLLFTNMNTIIENSKHRRK